MNEKDDLRPDDPSLRLFFSNDTLYLKKEATDMNPSIPVSSPADKDLENPAIPVFEGGKNAHLLMIFSHDGSSALTGDWGAMVSGLIQNEKAMNLKPDEVALVNLKQNPDMTPESLFTHFSAEKIVVWGNSGEPLIDDLSPFENKHLFGKSLYKLDEASSYMSKEAKGLLWNFIKTHLLA